MARHSKKQSKCESSLKSKGTVKKVSSKKTEMKAVSLQIETESDEIISNMVSECETFANKIRAQGIGIALNLSEKYANMKVKDFCTSASDMPASKLVSLILDGVKDEKDKPSEEMLKYLSEGLNSISSEMKS